MMKLFRSALFIFIFLMIVQCGWLPGKPLTRMILKVNGHPVDAEIAATPDDRERGLMYRTSLGESEGMLFVFPYAEPLTFWMKNTKIALDVAFFDEQGYLINVETMEPDDGKKLYSSKESAKYALEMRAGWFKKRALRKYSRLELPRDIKGH